MPDGNVSHSPVSHSGLRSSGSTARVTVSYPWISGESYEVRLMTSTGATIDYELEDAEAGTRAA